MGWNKLHVAKLPFKRLFDKGIKVFMCDQSRHTWKYPTGVHTWNLFLIVQLQKDVLWWLHVPTKSMFDWFSEAGCAYMSVNCALIGSDNSWSPVRCGAVIWTDTVILLIGPLGTYFRETKMKILSAKLYSVFLGLNVLRSQGGYEGPRFRNPLHERFMSAQSKSL